MSVSPDDTRRAAASDSPALLLAGLLSTVGYSILVALPTSNRGAHVLGYLAVMTALFALMAWSLRAAGRVSRSGSRRLLPLVLGFAALFRLLIWGAGLPAERPLAAAVDDLSGRRTALGPFLLYDNDLWRYLWDGHTLAAGVNPYSTTPGEARSDESLERLLLTDAPWPDVLDNVSYQNYVSVYPPLTQYFFAALALVAPGSVLAAKAALIGLDLALCLVLWRALAALGRPPLWSLAYAWNPAVIKEIAGSGHPDVLMMLPLTLAVIWAARGRCRASPTALAAAALAKLAPVALLPLLARRIRGSGVALFTGLGLLLGAPLAAGAGDWWAGLRRFSARWTFNSGPWSSLRWSAERLGAADAALWADVATTLAFVLIAVMAWRRAATEGELALHGAAFATLAALVLLRPAVMPWYTLWPLPFAVLAGRRTWIAFTGLAQLSYLFYVDPPWPFWWKWIEYGALVCWAWWSWGKGAVERSVGAKAGLSAR